MGSRTALKVAVTISILILLGFAIFMLMNPNTRLSGYVLLLVCVVDALLMRRVINQR